MATVKQMESTGQELQITDIRDKICYKLVNAERNAAMLREVPHRLWQDLAVVYYISPPECADNCILIGNGMMEMWGADEDTLYGHASRNTPALLKARITHIDEMINNLIQKMAGPEAELFAEKIDAGNPENMPPLFAVTNDCHTNGAAVILYDGFLEKFSRLTGYDIYILPSSIHETLFLPVPPGAPDADEHKLLQMVREINVCCLEPEDILSDNVYRYCAKDHSVRMVS